MLSHLDRILDLYVTAFRLFEILVICYLTCKNIAITKTFNHNFNNKIKFSHDAIMRCRNSLYSQICLNRTLIIKPDPCLKRNLYKVAMQDIFDPHNLNTFLFQNQKLVTRRFGLDRFHCTGTS